MGCFGFYGIDKIKIALNPLFLNIDLFNMKRHLDSKNRLTLHRSGQFYSLCIHAEYFENPHNIYLDIWRAITELFNAGYFIIPSMNYFCSFYFPYIYHFTLFIQQFEFYYDFPRSCVNYGPSDDLKDKFINIRGTLYSNDYKKHKRKSIVCIYNRNAKRKWNRNERFQEIDNSQRDVRLEFRLTRDNCEYLHFQNIEGSFDEIHNRYAPYLGIVLSNYVGHSVIFDDGCHSELQRNEGTHNEGFNQVRKYSENNRVRYTGELKKSEPYIKVKISELEKSMIIRDMKDKNEREKELNCQSA